MTDTPKTNDELRGLAADLVAVQEAERKRISQEIHDELGQLLTGLRMEIFSLNNLLSTKYPDDQEFLSRFAKTDRIIDTLLQSTKRIVASLRPNILEDKSFDEAIKSQVEAFAQRSGIECSIDIEIDDELLDATRTMALYRIVQESLTNISRHAKASRVEIGCREQEEAIVLEVKDNGAGFDPDSKSFVEGYGLMGMRERARLLGGDFSIKSLPSAGTQIQVRIPALTKR